MKILLLAFALLLGSAVEAPAFAAGSATCRVTPRKTVQNLTAGAVSSQSAAFGTGTSVIRVAAATSFYLAIGADPTATSSSILIIGGIPEFFGVKAGEKAAVLRTGGSDIAVSLVEGDR